MERFAQEFRITKDTRVLDIGGTPDCWELLAVRPRLVLLNTPRAGEELASAAEWVAGDGRTLPFRDQSFDVVFSNSVIEHVGDAESQRRFAREVMRVGRAWWVETPNRWFPVEQHLLTPFVHWLPKTWQRAMVLRWTVWQTLARVSEDRRRFYVEHYLRDVRLLGAGELREMFPQARVIRERVCGVTKSLVAFRKEV
ncbi:MAG TPA: methyltransferase domain-containing protein [Bryobacteraceae bacterium]|nr:methyltransferase domain-containing protein [Bryobacteraceae bacterium]